MDNTIPLLNSIEQDDREALVSRREAILRGAKTSAFVKMALLSGSAPVALAALSQEVYGQTSAATVTSVLQFALLLENLEAEFYKTVLNANAAGQPAVTATTNPQAAAFAPIRTALAGNAPALATLALIRDHEVAHVALLRAALGTNAGPVMTGANFDFTGGRNPTTSSGPFLAATNNLQFALAVTQAFEDTGVRAYKGQAPNLLRTNTLQTALQIHSMEARHAARIRRIRRTLNPTVDAIRYSGTIRGGGADAAGAPASIFTSAVAVPAASLTAAVAAFNAIYGGATSEANTTQGGVNVVPFGNANAATQAFDEPLTRAEVTAIVQPFIVAAVPAA